MQDSLLQSFHSPEVASLSASETNEVSPEKNIVVTQLSEDFQLRLGVIQEVLKPCDRVTYGQKLREAAEKLGVSVRSVQRLVKRWESDSSTALEADGRTQHAFDQCSHRTNQPASRI